MAHADVSTYMGAGDGSIIGSFVEDEFGNFFEVSHNPEYVEPKEDVQSFLLKGKPCFTKDYPHLVWVINEGDFMRKYMGGFRYAKLLKTRIHVVVDEGEDGPEVEVWKFKSARFHHYPRYREDRGYA